jgi:hypothetical protein
LESELVIFRGFPQALPRVAEALAEALKYNHKDTKKNKGIHSKLHFVLQKFT